MDISSLTQAAQTQPVPVEAQKPVQPVTPVLPTQRPETGEKRDAAQSGVAGSMDANVIMGKDTSLQFRIDRDFNSLVVSLLDSNGEVVRQIPSDLIMKIAQRIEQIQDKGYMGLDELA